MKYDKATIIGLKLRQSVHLRKLTRSELFSRMQLIRTVEPIAIQAFKDAEEEIWRNQEDDSPHGHPWHVSFHASQFPGDDPMACPRAALYQMMDFAPQEPLSRVARTTAIAGKALEVALVQTWHRSGILLSAAPDEDLQTGFEYPEAWLTGSVDSVILPPRWNKPLPVEIKTKFQKDIDLMQVGARGPDLGHVFQIKVQLALIRLTQAEKWPALDPVTHGIIYYLSRDRPSETAEFRVDYDERFFELGVARLKQWRAWFEEGFLPSIKPSKRHPMGWRWSYPPCQFCNFKKTCKLDHEAGVTDLNDSIGIDRTQAVRPDYDPESACLRVRARWKQKRDADGRITVSDSRTE